MKILTFLICVFFSSSLIADTYAVCKLNDDIYSIKFTKNKIFMNHNNNGLEDKSENIKTFSKEEVILIKELKKRETKILLDLCDYIPTDTVTKNLYQHCGTGTSAFSKLQNKNYAEEAHNLYNNMPNNYILYRIDRIFGQMTVKNYHYSLSANSKHDLKVQEHTHSNYYICESKDQTAF